MATEHIHFLTAALITAALVFLTVLIHYEVLRLISGIIPKLKIQPRLRILVVIYGAFFAHTLEVWLFAASYYLLNTHLMLGSFHGLTPAAHLYDFVYFSAVVYTSLGFGDILPKGHIRLIVGVEGLTGLLMIGWTASFTYLMMEKLWLDHRQPRKK
ncbi:MAG: two pore domain potassium channel family protein [Moraxellaceae bacterium]|nr:two pore domain potassium channel family protein [Pseudomonadales bacterium]MCB1674267.1 two pore domain potassium channel family protein [Pseudomonadales bacterium]MCP5174257.1 two pore domain potassium channel family protein [Moraxellaceae bacterium]MCP5176689.1 two pore domain potassium channel family protein [Moraxellaceae bacterium]HQV21659.1 ion channel [Agitococcus sp.]